MQQLNEFLKNADYGVVFTVGIWAVGLTTIGVVVVVLFHTLHLLGQKTFLPQPQKPIHGWNRQFYVASCVMIVFLLILIWLLSAWKQHLLPQ